MNIFFSSQKLSSLEDALEYKFKNEKILHEALTHKSCNIEFSNERLEFLGDAVLDLIVAEYLFARFYSEDEGVLSKLRASLVNEISFTKLANEINLGDYLMLSSSEELNKGRTKKSILSNAFEALMGAIYLDSDIATTRKIFNRIISNSYILDNLQNITDNKEESRHRIHTFLNDFKSELQEITQEMFNCIPEYKLISSEGPDHNKTFTVGVFINGIEYKKAVGKSKKEAQHEAARKTIIILRKKSENE